MYYLLNKIFNPLQGCTFIKIVELIMTPPFTSNLKKSGAVMKRNTISDGIVWKCLSVPECASHHQEHRRISPGQSYNGLRFSLWIKESALSG